jgi:beta-N-acetylhexosaminidase
MRQPGRRAERWSGAPGFGCSAHRRRVHFSQVTAGLRIAARRNEEPVYKHRIGIALFLASQLLIVVGPASATVDTPETRALCAFQSLDLQAKVGQVFMVNVDGASLSRHSADLLRSWQPGGIILFSRNAKTGAGVRALTAASQQTAAVPLLVATDQEGGSVVRIRDGITPLPAQSYYGSIGSSARVYADTFAEGIALKHLGVNLDLAPVVDVRVTPDSAIGSRSFGPSTSLDSALVAASVHGYQAAGIGATAKHFLGLGEVRANADLQLPVVKASRAQIEARDMPPMRSAVQSGVMAMMVTRVQIPALDPSGTTAYASPKIIHGVIRGELGFSGLLITDSLLTPAIFAGPGPTKAAIVALGAGDDLLLLGNGIKVDEPEITHVIRAVSAAVSAGTVPVSRLDEAAMQVLRLKARLGLLAAC